MSPSAISSQQDRGSIFEESSLMPIQPIRMSGQSHKDVEVSLLSKLNQEDRVFQVNVTTPIKIPTLPAENSSLELKVQIQVEVVQSDQENNLPGDFPAWGEPHEQSSSLQHTLMPENGALTATQNSGAQARNMPLSSVQRPAEEPQHHEDWGAQPVLPLSALSERKPVALDSTLQELQPEKKVLLPFTLPKTPSCLEDSCPEDQQKTTSLGLVPLVSNSQASQSASSTTLCPHCQILPSSTKENMENNLQEPTSGYQLASDQPTPRKYVRFSIPETTIHISVTRENENQPVRKAGVELVPSTKCSLEPLAKNDSQVPSLRNNPEKIPVHGKQPVEGDEQLDPKRKLLLSIPETRGPPSTASEEEEETRPFFKARKTLVPSAKGSMESLVKNNPQLPTPRNNPEKMPVYGKQTVESDDPTPKKKLLLSVPETRDHTSTASEEEKETRRVFKAKKTLVPAAKGSMESLAKNNPQLPTPRNNPEKIPVNGKQPVEGDGQLDPKRKLLLSIPGTRGPPSTASKKEEEMQPAFKARKTLMPSAKCSKDSLAKNNPQLPNPRNNPEKIPVHGKQSVEGDEQLDPKKKLLLSVLDTRDPTSTANEEETRPISKTRKTLLPSAKRSPEPQVKNSSRMPIPKDKPEKIPVDRKQPVKDEDQLSTWKKFLWGVPETGRQPFTASKKDDKTQPVSKARKSLVPSAQRSTEPQAKNKPQVSIPKDKPEKNPVDRKQPVEGEDQLNTWEKFLWGVPETGRHTSTPCKKKDKTQPVSKARKTLVPSAKCSIEPQVKNSPQVSIPKDKPEKIPVDRKQPVEGEDQLNTWEKFLWGVPETGRHTSTPCKKKDKTQPVSKARKTLVPSAQRSTEPQAKNSPQVPIPKDKQEKIPVDRKQPVKDEDQLSTWKKFLWGVPETGHQPSTASKKDDKTQPVSKARKTLVPSAQRSTEPRAKNKPQVSIPKDKPEKNPVDRKQPVEGEDQLNTWEKFLWGVPETGRHTSTPCKKKDKTQPVSKARKTLVPSAKRSIEPQVKNSPQVSIPKDKPEKIPVDRKQPVEGEDQLNTWEKFLWGVPETGRHTSTPCKKKDKTQPVSKARKTLVPSAQRSTEPQAKNSPQVPIPKDKQEKIPVDRKQPVKDEDQLSTWKKFLWGVPETERQPSTASKDDKTQPVSKARKTLVPSAQCSTEPQAKNKPQVSIPKDKLEKRPIYRKQPVERFDQPPPKKKRLLSVPETKSSSPTASKKKGETRPVPNGRELLVPSAKCSTEPQAKNDSPVSIWKFNPEMMPVYKTQPLVYSDRPHSWKKLLLIIPETTGNTPTASEKEEETQPASKDDSAQPATTHHSHHHTELDADATPDLNGHRKANM
ncbi:titin-like [Ornithorhynchus anatinus]|uniref:titin-like n=1 Tax=Ornithorhynchus anatinus TaxID=9258 RepID=UPI0010A9438F|nr:titin-like [Ornithorhynchus anatinus]